MSNSIDELKTAYDSVPMPENLNVIVSNAIKRGKIAVRNRRTKIGYVIKALSAIAAVFLVFVTALNVSPAFANTVEQLPGGKIIVKLVTVVVDTATIDSKRIGVQDAWETLQENLTVDLYQGDEAAATAGHFTVTKRTHPYSIEVSLAGVRAFSAANALPDLSKMRLFDDIYRLIPLDDSTDRFVITFTERVVLQYSAQPNPARLIIKVKDDRKATALSPATAPSTFPFYSLRTSSLPFGEEVGGAESMMRVELGSENARILRDDSGLYLAEEGLYATLAEAEARLAAVKQNANFTYELHIEKRISGATPRMISP